MRRIHHIVRLIALAAFVLSGQAPRLHHQAMRTPPDGRRWSMLPSFISALRELGESGVGDLLAERRRLWDRR
jgi:hypothetical protein